MNTTTPVEGSPLSAKSAKIALTVEKTVFPWVFLYLASRSLLAALGSYPTIEDLLHTTLTPAVFLFIRDVLLFFLLGFYGVMLLFSRPATALPTKNRHLWVPIAMSFYFLLYGTLDYLPPSLSENLLLPSLRGPCAVAGVFLSLMGHSIAIWAFFYLRRSFAIFVSVREIILKGPYAYVRHPMYLGYLLDSCGIALVSFSIATLLLSCGFVILLIYRSRMEEDKLREASASYRLYASHAGFLFPRFRNGGPPIIS